ncbi:MAG TPA: YhcH/YjgK/YiaL family protein [Bacteroidales bacterium]|nr:YhcH/YjgK/YiaL family protein [Bacteroidales bacterium]
MNPPVIIRSEREISPDTSINVSEFNRQYLLHPERWDRAFSFLRDTDLETLEKGRYEIEGSDLFASVDEYVTKDEPDTRLEAHSKFADIQYIISGAEKMGIVALDKTTVTVPYNEEKEICFLVSGDERFLSATPDRYFIFFPDDAHRPCLKARENAPVKKVVIKVRISRGPEV